MEWIWNPLKKRVGKYKLNTQLSPLDNLTLLNRYDYEDWDTYAIMNSNNSK